MMRSLMRHGGFPGVLAAAMGSAWLLHARGLPDPVVVFGVSTVITVLLLGLERWLPYEPAWRNKPGDFGVDALHVLFSNAIPGALIHGALFSVVLALSEKLGGRWWPTDWPLAAQVPLAILVGDFGSYCAHRIFHEVPWLWRFHAVHHSAERMYTLASARNHPINAAWTYAMQTLPLVAWGAPPEVLLLYTMFTAVLGLLQHSNVDFRTGWWSLFVSTPILHRWHHATDQVAGNSNYGADTAIWDRMFRTRFLPRDSEPHDVGLFDEQIRVNWWAHLLRPLR